MKLKKLLIRLINFYQKYVSVNKKPSCVFYPTCSEYTKEAIFKFGAIRGSFLSLRRILRCHPWQKNHIDKIK